MVGNLPDHVTRYNHKSTNRWMIVHAERTRISWDGILTGALMMISCAGLLTAAVFVLQMV